MSTTHQFYIAFHVCILFLAIALPLSLHASSATTSSTNMDMMEMPVPQNASTTNRVMPAILPAAVHTASSTQSATTPGVHAPAPFLTPIEIEQLVRTRFVTSAPAMVGIARCESMFRQYTDSGNVLRGGLGDTMIGVFQFNEGSHAERARALGYDIYTAEGNIGYAEYLYNALGTDPWISSFSCWGGGAQDPSVTISHDGDTLTDDLHFGQTSSQVRILQKLLNANGYAVAASGPGSKGNETTAFGALTRAAVRKFQCVKKIACAGDEYSTGYGLVNVKTRIALMAHTTSKTIAKPIKTVKTPITNTTPPDQVATQKKIDELLSLVAVLQKQLAALQH